MSSKGARRGRGVLLASLAVVAVVVVVTGACGEADTASPATTEATAGTGPDSTSTSGTNPTTIAPASEPDAPRDVRIPTTVLIDDNRPTDAGATSEPQSTRTLSTQVFVPPGEGPFPLIVFGHGLAGHPDDFTRLLTAWAEAGYLVAAPAFPLTNATVPSSSANFDDVINQPADVSFVIDEMSRLSDDPDSDIAGLVDLEHIGVAGLSLGGITTYAVVFSECCRDDRIDAAIVLAGDASTAPDFGAFVPTGAVPLLVMHGDADAVIGYEAAVESYALLEAPKYFVTLLGGGHAEPFADQSTAFAPIVDSVTVDFWNAYLDDDPEALAALIAGAAVGGLTTFEYDD